MNYLVIAICVIAIIMAIFCKINGLSLIYPTIVIILGIIADIIVNTITERKNKKEYTNLDEIKNKMKSKKLR